MQRGTKCKRITIKKITLYYIRLFFNSLAITVLLPTPNYLGVEANANVLCTLDSPVG